MTMAHRFTFYTPGSEAPEYTYIFLACSIVLLFVLSMLGFSLWIGNVLIAAVVSIVLSVILYLLVKRLELIKIGSIDKHPLLTWIGFIVILFPLILSSHHYLHNFFTDTNDDAKSYRSFIGMKAKEFRSTSTLFLTYENILNEFEVCEHGFLNLQDAIADATAEKERFLHLAANIKNPLNIVQMSEPLGATFDLQKQNLSAVFTKEIIGNCDSPVQMIDNTTFETRGYDFGLIGSLHKLNPTIFAPLVILIPLLLLSSFMMAKGRTQNLKENPYHQRKRRR